MSLIRYCDTKLINKLAATKIIILIPSLAITIYILFILLGFLLKDKNFKSQNINKDQ